MNNCAIRSASTEHQVHDEGAARRLAAEHLDFGAKVRIGHRADQVWVGLGLSRDGCECLFEVASSGGMERRRPDGGLEPARLRGFDQFGAHHAQILEQVERAALLRRRPVESRSARLILPARCRRIRTSFRNDAMSSDLVRTMEFAGASVRTRRVEAFAKQRFFKQGFVGCDSRGIHSASFVETRAAESLP